jgi:hypothetical protein
VPSVTESHPVSLETGGETDDLVTHANAENGSVPLDQSLPDSINSLHDTLWVTGTVGEEETVVLIPDGVEVKVPWEHSDHSITPD